MHRCQHNQKITDFCASQCCVWKQAGGCSTCIKKYHNHMGQTLFLKEEDVQNIVKKLIIDPNSKPKCRVIQQQIYTYFTTVKNELNSSIQVLCKTLINQLGYPYLNKNNNLFAFKRLKNKQYKKINQKQFRNLYDLSKKIDLKEVSKQQNKIYMEELYKNHTFIQQFQVLMKQYEEIIKKVSPNFHHESSSAKKVVELMNQVILNENKASKHSHTNSKRFQTPKQEKAQQKVLDQMSSPIHKLKNMSLQYSSTPSKNTQNLLFQPQKQRPTKDHYREVSVQKKITQKKKFTLILEEIKSQQNNSKIVFNTQRQNNSNVIYHEQIDSGSRKQFFNKEQQINSRKQKLIQMMRHKQISVGYEPKADSPKIIQRKRQVQSSIQKSIYKEQRPKVRSNEKFKEMYKEKSRQFILDKKEKEKQESPNKNFMELNNQTISQIMKQSSQTSNSFDSGGEAQLIRRLIPSVNMYAHSKLPIDDHQEQQKLFAIQKLIVVPAFRELTARNNECDSPLLKKKHQSKTTHSQSNSLRLQPFEKGMSRSLQQNYKNQAESKNAQIQLKDNQQKSLALLIKSINLKASEAIIYLQASLKYAPNNLSAAQYLTFLHLQNDNALQCLHVCNRVIDKFQVTKELEVMLVNLNNNKSAALNILGRYSQAIVILQKAVRLKQKQTLFKNLGDAYHLNGNMQKAIFNYQKAIKLQSNYDQAYYNLAACLYSQSNYNNARIWINKACELCPKKLQYLQLKKYIQEKVKKTETQF